MGTLRGQEDVPCPGGTSPMREVRGPSSGSRGVRSSGRPSETAMGRRSRRRVRAALTPLGLVDEAGIRHERIVAGAPDQNGRHKRNAPARSSRRRPRLPAHPASRGTSGPSIASGTSATIYALTKPWTRSARRVLPPTIPQTPTDPSWGCVTSNTPPTSSAGPAAVASTERDEMPPYRILRAGSHSYLRHRGRSRLEQLVRRATRKRQ